MYTLDPKKRKTHLNFNLHKQNKLTKPENTAGNMYVLNVWRGEGGGRTTVSKDHRQN